MRLTDLSRYNQWWKLGREFHSFDSDLRSIIYLINRRKYGFRVGNIYVIRGPRRSGKSVYAKLVVKNLLERGVKPKSILYVPCDRLSSRRELANIIRDFINFNVDSREIYIILDEITYLLDWYLVIKDLAETEVPNRICVITTGSSPISLKEASERLPGRSIEGNELWLLPISFREFLLDTPSKLLPLPIRKVEELRKVVKELDFKFEDPKLNWVSKVYPWHDELNTLLDIYLKTGGLPELIIEYVKNRRISEQKLEMLIRYILGEISRARRSETIAVGVLRYLTDNLMQRTDYHKIAKEVDAHHVTIREIIKTLQKALILFQLRHIDISSRRFSEKKQKKIAFIDPALITAIKSYTYGYSWEELEWEIEKIKPNLVENTVTVTAITSLHEPYTKEWWTRIGYYYTNAYEIDLVVQTKKQPLTYEVKYREKTKVARAELTITKDELKIEKKRVPASYILAATRKSRRII